LSAFRGDASAAGDTIIGFQGTGLIIIRLPFTPVLSLSLLSLILPLFHPGNDGRSVEEEEDCRARLPVRR
jgi:hypothetical protein